MLSLGCGFYPCLMKCLYPMFSGGFQTQCYFGAAESFSSSCLLSSYVCSGITHLSIQTALLHPEQFPVCSASTSVSGSIRQLHPVHPVSGQFRSTQLRSQWDWCHGAGSCVEWIFLYLPCTAPSNHPFGEEAEVFQKQTAKQSFLLGIRSYLALYKAYSTHTSKSKQAPCTTGKFY